MSSGVEFEQDQFSMTSKKIAMSHFATENTDERGLAGWLMRHKIAKSAKMAHFIQIGIIIINLFITFWFLSSVF